MIEVNQFCKTDELCNHVFFCSYKCRTLLFDHMGEYCIPVEDLVRQ
jgi:hypothetical protein